MTPSEFKAWFDGFTEAIEETPTRKQWARIKERVAEIDGKAITEKVYVDRYLPSYPYHPRPYWNRLGTVWCNAGAGNVGSIAQNSLQAQNQAAAAMQCANNFDSQVAMYALGKSEALAA